MKVNIWVLREDVWELGAWLKTPWDKSTAKSITFFHDKPVKQMDVVQISIDLNEYQKIIDNNEEIQYNIADQIGWTKTDTIGSDTNYQLKMLFGD